MLNVFAVPEGGDEKTEFEVYNFTGAGGAALILAGSHTPADLGFIGPNPVDVNAGVKFSSSYGEAAQEGVWLEQ